MKTLTVRLPAAIVNDIETESRQRHMSKSEIVRERLARRGAGRRRPSLDAIADLIGAVDALPADLSANRKRYLIDTHYGRTRTR